jgi:N-carbamoyl-L-amino-acid hydrolase
MCVAAIAPAAMIFVPSAGGRSHVGDEFTSPADLDLGVAALAQALVTIDRRMAKEG